MIDGLDAWEEEEAERRRTIADDKAKRDRELAKDRAAPPADEDPEDEEDED